LQLLTFDETLRNSSFQANVVCRQLGFEGALLVFSNSHFGFVPQKFSYDDVNCGGTETNLVYFG
jgi:hypothetical protein